MRWNYKLTFSYKHDLLHDMMTYSVYIYTKQTKSRTFRMKKDVYNFSLRCLEALCTLAFELVD